MALVMICDDHPDTCGVLRRIIRRMGPAVACFHRGADLVEAGRTVLPSLVLLDVTMPVMDGLETLAALKALPGWDGVPVVMFTAMSDPRTEAEAMRLGAADYWLKSGFDTGRLGALLARYVPVRQDA